MPKFPGFNLSLCESKPFPRHHTLSRRLVNEVLSFTEAGKKGLGLIESEATDLMLKRVRSCREKAFVLTSGMSAAAMPARQCGQSVAACLKPTRKWSRDEAKYNHTQHFAQHPLEGSSNYDALLQRPNTPPKAKHCLGPSIYHFVKKKTKKLAKS